MTVQQLRRLDVNKVRALMHQLGLSVDGVKDANQGLTRLFENALSIEDID